MTAVYRWIRSWMSESYGSTDIHKQLSKLREMAVVLKQAGIMLIVLESNDPEHGHLYAIGIATPLCQRVGCTHAARMTAFVDHCRGVDADMHHLIVCAVKTEFGSMPAGFAIVNRKCQPALKLAFTAMGAAMGPHSFGGQGHPQVLMTDDEPAEYLAFLEVFVGAIHVLCFFHVLQAMWKWLLAAE
ncbi:unnamed protein product, partial [Heterosigma akashiwo]